MSPNKVRWIALITNGLFLLTDQILKWQAIHNWRSPHLIFPYFGWQVFLNRGMAFGLPLANSAATLIALPIIGLIGYILYKELNKIPPAPNYLLAWSMLFTGAVSNLFDRLIYHQVIDYFLIGTGLINIADILIVGGLAIYLLNIKVSNKQ